MHGGAAPQVRRKAQERMAILVDPAIDRLAQLIKFGSAPAALRAATTALDGAGIGEGQDDPATPRRMTDEQWEDFKHRLEEARRKLVAEDE